MRTLLAIACVALLHVNLSSFAAAQEKVDAAMKVRYEKFEKLLTGAKFKGSFTLDDKPHRTGAGVWTTVRYALYDNVNLA